MACEIGAAVTDMEFIQVYPTCNPLTGIISYVANARMDGGILVNQSGSRFVNEMGRRDVVSNAILDQEGGYAYLVWGNEIEEAGHMTQVHQVEFEQWKQFGLLYEVNTIEEAAEAFGVDAAALTATVNAYNDSIADGVDEEYARIGTLRTIAEGPYYIQKVVPSAHHTMGGVVINTQAQVLDGDGNEIPGLFAAGEVTGDIHGTNRLGGDGGLHLADLSARAAGARRGHDARQIRSDFQLSVRTDRSTAAARADARPYGRHESESLPAWLCCRLDG